MRMQTFYPTFTLELAKHILERVPGKRLTFSGLKESLGGWHIIFVSPLYTVLTDKLEFVD